MIVFNILILKCSVDEHWDVDDRHPAGDSRRYDEKDRRVEVDDRRFDERQHVPSWRADEMARYDETARTDDYARGRKAKVGEERFERRDPKER